VCTRCDKFLERIQYVHTYIRIYIYTYIGRFPSFDVTQIRKILREAESNVRIFK
jgi:hypothetical protein